MAYCMYLRKSRADVEAESRGEGETFARHEKTLTELAARLSLDLIMPPYKEIVSGETIAARPEMQRLLYDVEQGLWDGVLVMEVERLARGDTKDQGIVAETFKYSNTKIITPMKTYDPNNEADEEYFEFGLFMSRREYKTIKRRLQGGRVTSVMEGKWIYSDPPFGYNKVKLKNDKGFTLEPHPDEAEIVKLIFSLYTESMMGSHRIAKTLTELGYKPRFSNAWSPASIRDILSNITYAGYIKKGERPEKPFMQNGVVTKRRVYNPDHLIVKGIHPPIISEETYNIAQQIKRSNTISSVNSNSSGLKNPLAGLLICGSCNRIMQMQEDRKDRKNPKQRLACLGFHCETASSLFDYVEDAVLNSIDIWLKNFKLSIEEQTAGEPTRDINKEAIQRLEKEKLLVHEQLSNAHDLVERGVYDDATFISRKSLLLKKIEDIDSAIANLNEKIRKGNDINQKREFVQKVETVLDAYHIAETAEEKNLLLKSIIEKIIYKKTKKGKGHEKAFEIEIYPHVDSF